ncbi:MAG: protein kinase [Deltaproteobacteria bacterium]
MDSEDYTITAPTPPVIAGRYRCGRVLGTGATSTVYEGRDTSTGAAVAIKRIFAEVSAYRDGGDLLRREVGVADRVRHEGLVQVYDAGQDSDGTFFIVMELLSGCTFEEQLESASASIATSLDIVEAVLEPLAALHAHGVVHRDLKPSNIFLTDDGRVKLLDLGIAKHAQDASVTKTGAGVGTPHYMAPEQAVSARDVTPAADVWSVGALLYRAVTGRLPFEGENAYEVVLKACTEVPPPVTHWTPDADTSLIALIERCLVKAPEHRISQAAEVAVALREVRAGTYVPMEAAAFVDPALAALARAATEPGDGETADASTQSAYRDVSIELPRSRRPKYAAMLFIVLGLGTAAGLAWWWSAPARRAPVAAPVRSTVPERVGGAGAAGGARALTGSGSETGSDSVTGSDSGSSSATEVGSDSGLATGSDSGSGTGSDSGSAFGSDSVTGSGSASDSVSGSGSDSVSGSGSDSVAGSGSASGSRTARRPRRAPKPASALGVASGSGRESESPSGSAFGSDSESAPDPDSDSDSASDPVTDSETDSESESDPDTESGSAAESAPDTTPPIRANDAGVRPAPPTTVAPPPPPPPKKKKEKKPAPFLTF